MKPRPHEPTRRYFVTWRSSFTGRRNVLRANLLIATESRLGALLRSVARWALGGQSESLRDLTLATWCLDTGVLEDELSLRVTARRPERYSPLDLPVPLEVRWRAKWIGESEVQGEAQTFASYADAWRFREHLEGWLCGVYPHQLERFRFTVVHADTEAVVEDLEAGKERIARAEDDVFLVLRAAGRLDGDFEHYVAFPDAEGADEFVAVHAEDEDEWIVESVSRERFERGDLAPKAAGALLEEALDVAIGEGGALGVIGARGR